MLFFYLRWEEVGLWNSEKGAAVDIRDILWPGGALKPPEGVPERGFLSVTFLEVFPVSITLRIMVMINLS